MEKINREIIGKHAESGRKVIANEKRTMHGRELINKEVRCGRNHSQWKKALRVGHVGV